MIHFFFVFKFPEECFKAHWAQIGNFDMHRGLIPHTLLLSMQRSAHLHNLKTGFYVMVE